MDIMTSLTTSFASTIVDSAQDAVAGLMKDDPAPVEAPNVVISDQSAVAESQIYGVSETPPALTASTVEQEVGQMNIQRYLRLDADTWATSSTAETKLKDWKLPDIFNSSKYPTYNLMKNYHWMRSDYEFNLVVNANMGFSGALVLVYIPQGAHFQFKTFRNFPHVMINCSLNTSARLKIPYINLTQYCGITGDDDNNGTIALYVLGQLRVPSSGGQEANWTLYGKLLSPEFQAFNVLESPPGVIRVEEAAGSMFLASRHHTALRPRMGLTSEQSRSDVAVVGDSAFRSLREVTNVESFWMGLDWAYTDTIGKRLLITNIKLAADEATGGISVKTNLGFLSNFYFGYKGDLTVTIQTISSRLNQGKLLVVFFPGEDNQDADLKIENINNGFTQVLDLGGKTTVRFTLPYVCQQTYRPISGVFGRFAVFVLNPLTYTPACVSTVRVLFYIGGSESFSFVYPRHGAVGFEAGSDDEVEPPVTNLEDEASTAHRAKRPVFRNVRVRIPDQIKSDHMLLSNLFGRAHALKPMTATVKDNTYSLTQTEKSFLSVFKLFRYRSGDMTLHVVHTSDGPLFAAHSYLAPDLGTNAEDNYSEVLSQGAVCMLPKTAASICVPFYVLTPFVSTTNYGKLLLSSPDDSSYTVRSSVTFDSNTRFYFLQSPPTAKTSYDSDFDDDADFCSFSARKTLDVVDDYPFKRDLTRDGDVESNPGPWFVLRSDGGLAIARNGRVMVPVHDRHGGIEWAIQPQRMFWRVVYVRDSFLDSYSSAVPSLHHLVQDSTMESDEEHKNAILSVTIVSMRPGWKRLRTFSLISLVAFFSAIDLAQAAFSRMRLMLSGDVEQNPGPRSQVFLGPDRTIHLQVEDQLLTLRDFSIAEERLTVTSSGPLPFPHNKGFWMSSQNIRSLFRTGRTQMSVGFFYLDNQTNFSDAFVESILPMLYALNTCALLDAEIGFETMMQWLLGIDSDSVANARAMSAVLEDTNIRRMLKDAGEGIAASLLRGLLRVLLYCMILSRDCSATTVMAITGLVAIDAMSVLWTAFQHSNIVSLVNFLLPGDSQIAINHRRRMVELLDSDAPMFTEGLFDDVTKVARGLEWWMKQIFKLAEMLQKQLNPDRVVRCNTLLDTKLDDIINLVAAVSDLKQRCRKEGKITNQERDEHDDILSKLVGYQKVALVVPRHPLQLPISQALSQLRSLNYGHRIPDDPIRPDPIGIHFYGDPGMGKTVLMTRICNVIAKSLNTEVFTHAPGSDFLDGYSGQQVHYIDEFMAHTQERESMLILQLMGCSQTIVPMAELEDKGMYYKAKVVVTTANTPCVSNSGLKFPKALLRRFQQIKFAAQPYYLKTKNGEQTFDIKKAIADKTFEDGSCWSYSLDDGGTWKTLNFLELADFVRQKVAVNEKIARDFIDIMKRDCERLEAEAGEDDDIDDVIQSLERPKPPGIFDKLRNPIQASKDACKAVKTWVSTMMDGWTPETVVEVSSRVMMVISVLRTVWGVYSFLKDLGTNKEEAPYDKAMRPDVKKVTVRRVRQVLKNKQTPQTPEHLTKESPVTQAHEFQHLIDAIVEIKFEAGYKVPLQGLALAGYSLLTYAHGIGSGRMTVQYGNMSLELEEDEYELAIFSTDDGDTDLCWIRLHKGIGIQFKNLTNSISTPEYGMDCVLVKKIGSNFEIRPMTNVVDSDYFMMVSDVSRLSGVRYGNFKYFGKHSRGDCGSLILQKIKGTWKMIGLHNSGAAAGQRCAGVRLDIVPTQMVLEGIVVHREAAGLTSFQPGKSSLRPSPFHGAFDITKEPAVLSKKDRRLTVNVDNLVKDNAGKYRVDRYTANETIMSFAMQKIKDRLVSHVSRGRMVSIEKAITGCGCNPIDSSTSPGFKYTKMGLKKTDLYRINDDGTVWVSDMLRTDVQAWIDSIDAGEVKQTLFNTVCKDELRSLEKVALGKTRVIEAAELDYVVAYRMYMSTIYSDLYESSAEDTGIAVGINPPADGHGLFLELNKYHTFMALDYSRFDGSLPAMLMRNAVEILASLHHDEDKVKLLHETVITSKHLVADEFWTVQGGMPSGSPCTTVLNCLCNLLVLEYAFLEIFGLGERDDQYRKHVDDHLIVVYGDDCIVAHNADEELGPAFKETIFTSFGMEVTPASKIGDVFEVPLDEVEFLKRKFFKIATVHSDRIAMRLSVETIRQSLMWMRSSKTFDDQVFSLAIELSAWGEEIYDQEFAACKRMLEGGSLQVNIPFWRAAWETYLGIVDWNVTGAMYPRDLWDPVLEIDDDDDADVVFFDDRLT